MTITGSNTGRPRYLVHWLISPLHDVELTCSLVAGLWELAHKGEIQLEIRELTAENYSPHLMRMDAVDLLSGNHRRLALDVLDRNDRFCGETLRTVDKYFKRNYWSAACNDFPSSIRKKVLPAGITFGCYVPGSRKTMIYSALVSFRARLRSEGLKYAPAAVGHLMRDLEQIRCFLSDSTWERSDADPTYNRVVFQTRLWDDRLEGDVDRGDVNRERTVLVRALREAFASPDTIGLLDSAFARRTASDAILSHKVSRSEYAVQLRSSLIAVNSHGLDGSGGFKVGESLAAGCAIVSQPFKFEMPVPLREGTNFLAFGSVSECVEQCRRLIDNPEMADQMRTENLKYYHRHIKPVSIARGIITRAFDT